MEERTVEGLKGLRVDHSPLPPFCSHHVKERNGLSPAQMRAAMDAVSKGITVTRASKEYEVPRSTLHDRVHGNTWYHRY